MRSIHPFHLEELQRDWLGAELPPADAVRVILQTLGAGEADVLAVEVHTPAAAPRRVTRRHGESLDSLVARAGPGTMAPAPIFKGERHETDDGRAVREVLSRCVRLVQEPAA
jgi:hypothetical protein